MPTFTLDTRADSLNAGIGGIFKALAMSPYLEQQAQQKSALSESQAYHQTMSGNKAGAEAENIGLTVANRKRVPEMIANGTDLPAHDRAMLNLFQLTGDTNSHRLSQAGTEFQTQRFRDQALGQVGESLPNVNTLISLAANKPYLPYDNVGNTGVSIDKATGAQVAANDVLGRLYAGTQTSLTNQRNAAAGASTAQAGLSKERTLAVQQGAPMEGEDEAGNPVVYRAGTASVSTVPGVKPLVKASSTDAALAKARSKIVSEVARDTSVRPDDRPAEVERRMALVEGREPDANIVKPPEKKPGLIERWLKPAEAKKPEAASAPVKIASKAEYDQLPKGAAYIDPTGTKRTKN